MKQEVVPEPLIKANSSLTVSLLQRIYQATPTENIFLSPTSLYLALGLLYLGASGRTQRTLAEVLGLHGLPNAEEALTALCTSISGIRGKSSLLVANALWIDHATLIAPHFRDKVRLRLGAEARSLDFASPSALAKINGWTTEATNGKIVDLLSPADLVPPVHAVVTSAAYFYGPWQNPFLPQHTRQGVFTCADGAQQQLMMMSQVKELFALETERFQAVSLPYTSNRLHCCLFLPREEVGMEDFLNGLDSSSFTTWLTDLMPLGSSKTLSRGIHLILPRYKASFSVDLTPALMELGLNVLFTRQADFTAMGLSDSFFKQVKHQAFVAMDEKGTEAAAATAVIMTRGGGPSIESVIRLDRPFVCVLRDSLTGMILFAGIINAPEGEMPTLEGLLAAGQGTRTARAANALKVAIQQDNVPAIRLLLDSGVNIRGKQGNLGESFLSTAIHSASSEVVTLLLAHGADTNALDYGQSPISAAAQAERQDILELLHQYGADVNSVSDQGLTPLMSAALSNDVEIVDWLLNHGADAARVDDDGESALTHAIQGVAFSDNQENPFASLDRLLTHRCPINVAVPVLCGRPETTTPLHLAYDKGNLDIAERLLAHGAAVDFADGAGTTALMKAANDGDMTRIRHLLSHSASVDLRNTAGETALLLAAHFGHSRVITTLLGGAGDVNMPSRLGQTPLMHAAASGHIESCTVLIAHGADVSLADLEGKTALVYAAECPSTPVVLLLLEQGADPRDQDAKHSTALHAVLGIRFSYQETLLQQQSAEKRQAMLSIMTALLKHGADVGAADEQGFTALHIAASHADLSHVQFLIEHGAQVNATNAYGGTPLMIAIMRGRVEAARLLLASGSDPRQKDVQGHSAITLAQRHGDHWLGVLPPSDSEV